MTVVVTQPDDATLRRARRARVMAAMEEADVDFLIVGREGDAWRQLVGLGGNRRCRYKKKNQVASQDGAYAISRHPAILVDSARSGERQSRERKR